MKKTIIGIVLMMLIIVNTAQAITYCENDNYIEEIVINKNTTLHIDNGECSHGCTNNSIMFLGNPACKENEFMSFLLAVVVIILFVSVIWWLVQ